jgi:hypothetical protein
MSDYYGQPIRKLTSKSLELECLATAGPRIVRLSYNGSANLFAEVPEISTSTPFGDYRFLGGHRLWYAPEAMPRSYIPDNDGLVVSEIPGGLILDGKTETASGIHKRIEVQLNPERTEVDLVHVLINDGIWEVELAPWAISMFRLGGVAILPIRSSTILQGLLPDRHLSLWPYSQVHDPRLHWDDEFILINPAPEMPPFKIGAFNNSGWVAYWLDGILFRKSFAVYPDQPHADFGCNAEIYCNTRFIELESLSPLTKLAPGQSIRYSENWSFFDNLEQEFLSDSMIECCRMQIG